MSSRRRWSRVGALAWRESRTARRRLLLYMSSISLGVAALVAIDSFAGNLTRSVREQSRALLGGDVNLRSRRPFPAPIDSLLDSLSSAGVGRANLTSFTSMAVLSSSRSGERAGQGPGGSETGIGATRLVQVRAAGEGFPFYGEMITEPSQAWNELHTGRHVVVDPSLLVSLGASLGDSLSLGFIRFAITGVLRSIPGDVGVTAAIGPRVYIPERHLMRTGLLVFGSRAEYETLLKLPSDVAPHRFVSAHRETLRDNEVRARTVAQTEADLTGAIEQLGIFLGIVGLVALLLGGIGVASGVHAFVTRKIDTVAVLRCLGATSGQVLAIYVAQATLMGLVGAAAGAALGVAIQYAVPVVLAEFLPVDVAVRPEARAILLGLAVGLAVALLFALRPLVALRNVSPLQALRRDTDSDALRLHWNDWARHLVGAAIIAAVVTIAIARAGSLPRGLALSAAIGAVVATLWLSAGALARGVRRVLGASWPFAVRQGLANLYRPANQTRAVVIALGFGSFLIATLYQVQHSLVNNLRIGTEATRANIVFFDVQQQQRDGVVSAVRRDGHEVLQVSPIVVMRLAEINGRTAAELQRLPREEDRPSGWALRREYRSTYRDTMVASERLVEGRWLSPSTAMNGGIGEVSLERDLAEELLVVPGDTIVWDVQGVRVPTRLTSTREVEWARFEPNFFAVFSPAAVRDAPQQFVIMAEVHGAEALGRLQREMVASYPNVSSLDLTTVQRTIGDILRRVSGAIRFIALFSVAIGIPVLFSAVAATRRERLREGVLLKTLGATRAQIRRIMLAEYTLLGLLGGLTGVLLSLAGTWALTRFLFNVPFVVAVQPAILLLVAMIVVTVTIGLVTGREVFARTPMAALRES